MRVLSERKAICVCTEHVALYQVDTVDHLHLISLCCRVALCITEILLLTDLGMSDQIDRLQC